MWNILLRLIFFDILYKLQNGPFPPFSSRNREYYFYERRKRRGGQKYRAAIRQMLANIYQFRPNQFRVTGEKVRRFPRTVCHRGPPRFFCSICTSNLADSGANLSNQVSHRWLPHCDNLRRPRVPGVKSREEATSFRNIFGHSFLTQSVSRITDKRIK